MIGGCDRKVCDNGTGRGAWDEGRKEKRQCRNLSVGQEPDPPNYYSLLIIRYSPFATV
ncbi:hypothetical protein [Fervidibacter sacchari]